jgi:hypothetical protein
MPDTTWSVDRYPPGSSRGNDSTPVLMSSLRFRHFIAIHSRSPSWLTPDASRRLVRSTPTLNRSASRWFEAFPCRTAPRAKTSISGTAPLRRPAPAARRPAHAAGRRSAHHRRHRRHHHANARRQERRRRPARSSPAVIGSAGKAWNVSHAAALFRGGGAGPSRRAGLGGHASAHVSFWWRQIQMESPRSSVHTPWPVSTVPAGVTSVKIVSS